MGNLTGLYLSENPGTWSKSFLWPEELSFLEVTSGTLGMPRTQRWSQCLKVARYGDARISPSPILELSFHMRNTLLTI